MSIIKQIEKRMNPLFWEYRQLVTPSEVPDEFHLFVFMTMLSGLVGDRVYYKEGGDTIYPTLWTMLVGESGITRKSTSFRPALRVLSKVENVNLLAPSASPEGFFKELAEYNGVGLLRHGELGTLLGSLRKDYMGGFVDFLCELYDPLPMGLKRRLSKEIISIDRVAVSWIAATTPDSLNKCVAGSRIAGGFLPRWNIVFGSPATTFVSFRQRKTDDYFIPFTGKLKALKPAEETEIRFNEEAIEVHREWYVKKRSCVVGEDLGYFHIRILEVVKKYAVLLAFLGGQDKVNRGIMETALMFGDYFYDTAERLLTTEITANPFEADCQRILKKLAQSKNGTCKVRDLLRNLHFNTKDLVARMETLQHRGDIEVKGNTCCIKSDKATE